MHLVTFIKTFLTQKMPMFSRPVLRPDRAQRPVGGRFPASSLRGAWWWGRRSVGQQLRWLSIALASALTALAITAAVSLRQADRVGQQVAGTGQALMQGQQEVVVKHLGPQLAHLPGLAGVTVSPSGAVVLIYNPVALAAVHGTQIRDSAEALGQLEAAVGSAPLVLVVDDSITVRRVTQRLLQREGYRVALAGDGLQALEQLALETPAVVLSDIEMPRMDGFDLVRNLRADERWAGLPVVMITSRIAQKHREHADDLGVNHYLGKPYPEDELLALVGRYALTPRTS
jgi:CheY-like chemotaxis protein